MRLSLKWTVIFETLLILLLVVVVALELKNTNMPNNQDSITTAASNYNYRLLAPSVNAGVLKPQSFLIFNFNSLKEYLYQVIRSNNLDVSIYILNMRDGKNFAIQGDRGAFPASLNKIPVAVIVLNKIERGN